MQPNINRPDFEDSVPVSYRDLAEKVMGWELDQDYYICGTGKDFATIHVSDWNPMERIQDAWLVHSKAMETFIFSRRKKYFDAMRESVSARKLDRYPDVKVAWPDVMIWITPEDFCKAALEAVK